MTFMQQILNKIMMKIFKKKNYPLCQGKKRCLYTIKIEQNNDEIFKKKLSPVTRKKRCHLYNRNRTN